MVTSVFLLILLTALTGLVVALLAPSVFNRLFRVRWSRGVWVGLMALVTCVAIVGASVAAVIGGGQNSVFLEASQTDSKSSGSASAKQQDKLATDNKRSTTNVKNPSDVPDKAQKVEVWQIVDGDTIEVTGLNFTSSYTADVRLLEINTPETKHPTEPDQCYGKQATDALARLLPTGSTAYVLRDKDLKDQYGRFLLYIWNDEGVFVNLRMVKDGYAEASLFMPNDLYWDVISNAENTAQQADKGAWGACSYFGEPVGQEYSQNDDTHAAPIPTPDPPRTGSYPVPPSPPDYDCGQISATGFTVRPGDPHRFDGDGDGIGCEG